MSTNTANLSELSGTITTGGTSQLVQAATQRQYLLVHNPTTATEPLLVRFGGAAAATNAVSLAPGGTLTFETGVVPGQSLNLNAATAGHVFIVWWA